MSSCFCGSGKSHNECCGPILNGSKKAESPGLLMRARYSAFCLQDMAFLSNSLHPNHRQDHDVEATRRWAADADWLGLEIVSEGTSGTQDESGYVEFIATFKEKGVVRNHHEKSQFEWFDGRWYFVDGEMVSAPTRVNKGPKIGRNDPCPCGSGKKFKRCCGAA